MIGMWSPNGWGWGLSPPLGLFRWSGSSSLLCYALSNLICRSSLVAAATMIRWEAIGNGGVAVCFPFVSTFPSAIYCLIVLFWTCCICFPFSRLAQSRTAKLSLVHYLGVMDALLVHGGCRIKEGTKQRWGWLEGETSIHSVLCPPSPPFSSIIPAVFPL